MDSKTLQEGCPLEKYNSVSVLCPTALVMILKIFPSKWKQRIIVQVRIHINPISLVSFLGGSEDEGLAILYICLCFRIGPGREYSIDPANDCLDDSRDTGNNNSFLLGYFNHTRQRCCFNISIVDDDNQEEMVIELNVTLSQADARSLLPIDIIPDVITVVFVDDNQCGKLQSFIA